MQNSPALAPYVWLERAVQEASLQTKEWLKKEAVKL